VDLDGARKDALHEGAHWRNVTNTIEPFVCCGGAAFLSNYVDRLLLLLFLYPGIKTRHYYYFWKIFKNKVPSVVKIPMAKN